MNEKNTAIGVLMLDLEGLVLAKNEEELLQRQCVGGVILFSRNYSSPNQLRELVLAIRACKPNILIAVDQEGGRVQRFREQFLKLPALREIGLVYEQDQRQGLDLARDCAWAMAAEILHYGIDFSFAPVLDLYSLDSRVIKERSFAASPDSVSKLGNAYIEGMHVAGMAATGKHFPGHGTVVADSHVELPTDSRAMDEIRAQDLQVFAACAEKLDAIMPAHIVYPTVDDVCAGFSKTWLQTVLRGELGFKGVIFSDDLSMDAAHSVGNVIARADLALSAGCDMVLVCNDQENAIMLADSLDEQSESTNTKLASMSGKFSPENDDLYNSDRWQEISELVSKLSKK